MINVIYRLSDNGYVKPKFPHATKKYCLENALKIFGAQNVHLFVDETNLTSDTRAYVDSNTTLRYKEYYTGGSSAGSWRHVFDYAIKTFGDNQIVYFLEDDYLHLYRSDVAITEGLDRADYVSLYDHMDKYISREAGGNYFVDEDCGEATKVFRTKSFHWKLTNSTTMTFATTVEQLKLDERTWRDYTQGAHPNDFGCFLALRDLGRSLITPIPGLSTHCEPKWASPGIDWSLV